MIKSYKDLEIDIIQKPERPSESLSLAYSITMRKSPNKSFKITEDKLKDLLKMGHTSLLEHLTYSFLIKNTSRSFLSQITRHRMSSFTSGSQHYQDYSDRDFLVSPKYSSEPLFQEALESSLEYYKKLLKKGISKEEARQVLPNAMDNNILWTINARSLINFFNLRTCKRNTEEMNYFSNYLLSIMRKEYPPLYNNIGPDCFMQGACTQQKMSCGSRWSLEDCLR